MESESGMTNTKISDSGYSNSSNTNSKRSVSSKSRLSSSSKSSGYCETKPDAIVESGLQPPKRNKDKEHKKTKLNSTSSTTNIPKSTVESTNFAETRTEKEPTVEQNMADTPPPEEYLQNWMERASKVKPDSKFVAEKTADPVAEKVKISSKPEGGFCCVISMYDGVVLYTTSSLTSVLGFPQDMWLGRSFIDFVHPKDRETFCNQVTTGIALPLFDSQGKYKDYKNCLYVCLRKYRGLKSYGFGVVEKKVSYQAFQLTVKLKHVTDASKTEDKENNNGMFLVVVAVPVYTPYSVPEERMKSAKFGMRHTAACVFSHVDPDVVTNFGFLPQDMLGKSIFDFYHPEDMPFLKENYESVMKICQIAGSVFRSKPYRFAVQNGGFAMIETEWSSFVNPLSRRLEFVIGLHRVLQGPLNPNIFDSYSGEDTKTLSEEVTKKSKLIQGEILQLLNKELSRPTEVVRQEVSKRCKYLANIMESLMEEVGKSTLQLELPQEVDPTFSERDSAMLGEISPHHDYCDSKSSSETPPSYNQLNYNENIQRFFQSKPKTTVSDESNGNVVIDAEPEVKKAQESPKKCDSPTQNSGASGSGSAGNLSSSSNPNVESSTSVTNSNDFYKPKHLTESLLSRHNEDMEKIMIKKHRELRCIIKDREGKRNHINFDKNEQILAGYTHGVKRCGSYLRDSDNHKYSKHKHQSNIANPKEDGGQAANNGGQVPSPTKSAKVQNSRAPTPMDCKNDIFQSGLNNMNLWPPFSVTVAPVSNTPHPQVCTLNSTPAALETSAPGMFPLYYFPATQPRTLPVSLMDTGLPPRYQVQYMPGMMYNYNNPLYPTSPIICPSFPMLPVPTIPTIPSINPDAHLLNMQANKATLQSSAILQLDLKHGTPVTSAQLQRPASQATSVKAEPGSAVESIASANKVADLPQAVKQNIYRNSNNNNVDEESSCYSSSYSSFFKTDTGSASNDDSNIIYSKNNRSDDNTWAGCRNCTIRKKDPPWLESVSTSPDLIYRYQVTIKDLEDILQADLSTLKGMAQPALVNDQLNQLYADMELEGLSKKLPLEEGITSSSSSEESDNSTKFYKPKKKRKSYGSLVMIYEENAPFPSPTN